MQRYPNKKTLYWCYVIILLYLCGAPVEFARSLHVVQAFNIGTWVEATMRKAVSSFLLSDVYF